MNVYVESNFVLELALLQEQYPSCEEILSLCEAHRVRLIIPAYCLAEPYETLTRRRKQRKRIKKELDGELRQIARTATYADRLSGFRRLTDLLINIAEEEARRFEEVRSRVAEAAEVVTLDASVLSAGTKYQRLQGFSPQDALVYSSVLSHLERVSAPQSCFLNRNSKDFDDQNAVEHLERYNCKLLPRFDSGCAFIVNALR